MMGKLKDENMLRELKKRKYDGSGGRGAELDIHASTKTSAPALVNNYYLN